MPISGSGIEYAVRIRDSSFNILAELDDYESLDYTGRFNDVGEWTMVVSKASPHASLLVRGNGIVVSDVTNGFIVFSGPIRTVTRLGTNQAQNLKVDGWDDMVWLKRRLIWPALGYYGAVISDTPIRYYRLGDGGLASVITTSVAQDYGSQQQNGAYKPTNNAGMPVSGIQTNTCIPFDTDGAIVGTGTSYIECPASGLPTGNSPIGFECLVIIEIAPVTNNCVLMEYGTNANHQLFGLVATTSGTVEAWLGGAGTINSGVLTTGKWHHVALAWDGTTLTLYVDGASVGTSTPGNQTIPGSGNTFRLGANVVGGEILQNGIILLDECAVFTTTLTAGRVLSHYNRSAARGPSGAFSQSAYDVESGQASSLIFYYVRVNLGPLANPDRWPGNITNYARAPLTMAADPFIGGTVAAASRLDNLLLLCQVLALAAGDIGFSIVQSTVGGSASGALTFTIFGPTNRTGIVFSEPLGTLGEYTFVQDESTDNFCIAGGSGTGTARVFGYTGDETSLKLFGRIEGLLNASSTSDVTTLQTLAFDEVTKSSNDHAITATPVEVTHMVYGVDYALGDKVTIVVDGITTTDIVREAELHLTPTDGAVWAPTIGSADAKSLNDLLKDMYKSIKRAGSRIQFLDAVQ